MTFPLVKTSPYGVYRAAQSSLLWSEAFWRSRVLSALLLVSFGDRRLMAELCGFRYTVGELLGGR